MMAHGHQGADWAASRLLKYSLRGVEGGSQTLLGKESPQENLGKWRLQVAQGFLEASRLVYFNSLLDGRRSSRSFFTQIAIML
jgi:hypothetical protein